MSKKMLRIGALLAVGVLVLGAIAVWVLPVSAQAGYGGPQSAGRGPATNGPANPVPVFSGVVGGDLSESEEEALLIALDDEYKAWSVYDQAIADFGAVRPFTSIRSAENQHIAALVTLFDRYGLDVPENNWPGNVPTFDTLTEACAGGVQVETDNVALYDELLSTVDNADIVQVFTALQQASQAKHLPAFDRCAP